MPGGVGKHFWDESLRTCFGEQGREMGWPPSCLSVPTNARVPHSRVMSSDTAPPPPAPRPTPQENQPGLSWDPTGASSLWPSVLVLVSVTEPRLGC